MIRFINLEANLPRTSKQKLPDVYKADRKDELVKSFTPKPILSKYTDQFKIKPQAKSKKLLTSIGKRCKNVKDHPITLDRKFK